MILYSAVISDGLVSGRWTPRNALHGRDEEKRIPRTLALPRSPDQLTAPLTSGALRYVSIH